MFGFGTFTDFRGRSNKIWRFMRFNFLIASLSQFEGNMTGELGLWWDIVFLIVRYFLSPETHSEEQNASIVIPSWSLQMYIHWNWVETRLLWINPSRVCINKQKSAKLLKYNPCIVFKSSTNKALLGAKLQKSPWDQHSRSFLRSNFKNHLEKNSKNLSGSSYNILLGTKS